jgi:hypothetical protein
MLIQNSWWNTEASNWISTEYVELIKHIP